MPSKSAPASSPLSIGRVVHVRIGGTDDAPILRAADAVNVHDGGATVWVKLDRFRDSVVAPADAGIFDGHLLVLPACREGVGLFEWRWPART